jgi:hypothetical protein
LHRRISADGRPRHLPKLVKVQRFFRQAHGSGGNQGQLLFTRILGDERDQLGDGQISIADDDDFAALCIGQVGAEPILKSRYIDAAHGNLVMAIVAMNGATASY